MSKGDIIFLLDSDDFFKKNKVQKIVNHFLNNKTKKIVFDFPIIKKRTKEKFVENKIVKVIPILNPRYTIFLAFIFPYDLLARSVIKNAIG